MQPNTINQQQDSLSSRRFPAEIKARAKTLYLVKSLQPTDIAAKLGIPVRCVYNFVKRGGWAQLRRDKLGEINNKINNATALMPDMDEFMVSVAAESEDIALAGFERARQAVQSDSEFAAKDFASWTSGVKSLVGMYRTAKGLDAAANAPQTLAFASFYLPPAPAAPKPVDPVDAADVVDGEVTDIPADPAS